MMDMVSESDPIVTATIKVLHIFVCELTNRLKRGANDSHHAIFHISCEDPQANNERFFGSERLSLAFSLSLSPRERESNMTFLNGPLTTIA